MWINGEEVGLLWSIPFQARVGQYLKEGENTIKVEVANLMANRIRDMDKKENPLLQACWGRLPLHLMKL